MTDTKRDIPELFLLPPFYPLIALALAAVLDLLIPVELFPAPAWLGWTTVAGAVLVIAGFALAASSARTFKAAGTNVEPFKPSLKIVTSGPYRWSRNPIYIGFQLIYLGLCLGFALEWGVLLLPFLWFVLDRMVVAREEAYLFNKFGSEYSTYLSKTRRWL